MKANEHRTTRKYHSTESYYRERIQKIIDSGERNANKMRRVGKKDDEKNGVKDKTTISLHT